MKDLAWLRNRANLSLPAIDFTTWPQWWHFIKETGNLFRKAISRATLQETRIFVLNGLYDLNDRAMTRRVCRDFPGTTSSGSVHTWVCLPCRKTFATKCNLACHFFRTHGRVAHQRRYPGGTICPNCKVQYFDGHRILRHLQMNPGCWQAVVQLGYCGDGKQDSVGSRAWKRHRLTQPILCPPQPCRDAVVQPPECFNNNASPVHDLMTQMAGTIGEWIESSAVLEEPPLSLEVLLQIFAKVPLYADEYQLVLQQVLQDVQLCFAERILAWCEPLYSAVCTWIQSICSDISGSWLVYMVFGFIPERDDGMKLRRDRLPTIQVELAARTIAFDTVLFVGHWMHTEERTRIELLAGSTHCRLMIDAGSSVEDASSQTAVVLQVLGEWEAADSSDTAESSLSAALHGCIPCPPFSELRGLRQLLILWRPIWSRLLKGCTVGLSCHAPFLWAEVLCGSFRTCLAHWELQPTAYGWLLFVSPKPPFASSN